jgi:glycosyltransferase involved in cell wall biosynthesis
MWVRKGMGMKISLLAKSDFAWLGYIFSQCLQRLGVDAKMFIMENIFARERTASRGECGVIFNSINQIKKELIESDSIQFMQGQFLNTGLDLSKKRVFVFYGGSNYRKNYEDLNKIFNPIVEKSIIQTGDLLGLGAKNEVWLLPGIDAENIYPVFMKPDKTKKITIGHFPSSAKTKGSEQINNSMEKLKRKFGDKFTYIYSDEMVSWAEQLNRMSKCDIYIEACMPALKGKRYGEWGMSALEGAALGKIVVSHFRSYPKYKKVYGEECGIVVANTVDQLETQLKWLLQLSATELLELQYRTRQWLEDKHSYEPVGMKMKDEIYEI